MSLNQNLNGRRDFFVKERRIRTRFPIEMDATFWVKKGRTVVWTPGRTINVSSTGILVGTECLPKLGCKIEVSLAWPCFLDSRVPLKLIVKGRVVRSKDGQVAIAIQQSEFRTARDGRQRLTPAIAGAEN